MMSLEKNTLEFLKSVISSHATFNALSAVQNYIVSDEKRSALLSLSSFAKYIRKMTNASVAEELAVCDDLLFVQSYLDMELLRFGDDIRFDISLDKELLESTELIPSFIIQPMIERTLLLGLKTGSRNFTFGVKASAVNGELVVTLSLNKIIEKDLSATFSMEQKNRMDLLKERLDLVGERVNVEEGANKDGYINKITITLN